ncbi:hypothetical protein Taro_015330 [Colocasia esculenta]|uniref:Very-long-chain (3R)-3-hydroxyacyl-CoA dehydratase n=1 Tax=Colocasia esculenta TaxID=4460 RepID=A0A843UH23_COLES|nr:hypothetical protein [Colocasia esculenta]
MSPTARLYLLAYNSLQLLGWAIALTRVLSSCLSAKSFHVAYAAGGDLICNLLRFSFLSGSPAPPLLKSVSVPNKVCIFFFAFVAEGILQSLSFLEVLHAATGLVPSGAMLTLMQWGGRTHFLLAIVRQIAEIQELPQVFITFVAWSASEAIRYSHYALTGVGFCPRWLIYLRYTAFILLYPVGVGPGEIWIMYQSLPFIQERNLHSSLFGRLPFSYYTFVTVLLLCYPFLWLKLYLHLLKQRRSKLGKPHAKKK